jgi:hypothetical protein
VIGFNRDAAVSPELLGAPTHPIAEAARTANGSIPEPITLTRRTEYVSDGSFGRRQNVIKVMAENLWVPNINPGG